MSPELAEEDLDFDRLPVELATPSIPMRFEAVAWKGYLAAKAEFGADLANQAFTMLSAENAAMRATGAIWLLEENGRLDIALLDRLILDEDPLVPLSVLGWMIDMGRMDLAEDFEARGKQTDAWAVAMEAAAGRNEHSVDIGTAIRAALWMADRSDWEEERITEFLAAVADDAGMPYDARWMAVLLLRDHGDFSEFQKMAASYIPAASPRRADAAPMQETPPRIRITPFLTAMVLLNERISGPADVVAQTSSVLSAEDVDLFFAQESALMLENIAFWVEAAVDRRSVEVLAGFTAALTDRLAELPGDALPAHQVLTLRRIEQRIEALRQREDVASQLR